MRILVRAALIGLFTAQTFAAPLSGFSAADQDWEVACDNTGTCRAAGYGVNMGEVSVLLTRRPGPHTSAQVAFGQIDNDIPSGAKARLFIDDADQGELEAKDNAHFYLSDDQLHALLPALLHHDHIEFSLNDQRKTLSTAGSDAILQKIDAFQRLGGTPDALALKGDADSDNALAAVPPPEIIAAPVSHNAAAKPLPTELAARLRPQLMAQIAGRCDSPGADNPLTLIALDKTHWLIQRLCWRAAYNEGYALWLVDKAQPTHPRLITTEAAGYANGAIAFENKGRGIADCLSGEERIWDGKTFVPSLQYSTGMCREIAPGGSWMLPTFVSEVRSRQDKETDDSALKALHNAVLKEQKTNPELDLHNIAAQFPLTGHITAFTLTYGADDALPTNKPSVDISDDEWRAFLRSAISVDTESGNVSFMLADLDGDGKRDLIVSSYVGGGGSFRYTGVLKRDGDAFYVIDRYAGDDDDDDTGVPGALFSENIRGANQWSRWVRINGQIYALWFNGQFGEDNLYLLRPFSPTAPAPAVTIRYRYALNIVNTPQAGQPPTPALSDRDRAGLLQALGTMQSNLLKDQTVAEKSEPICPIPPGTSADDAENYYSGIVTHYVYETVAYIPVWIKDQCFIGTVVSHHGFYRHGVDAELTINSPREDEDVVGDYPLTGLRQAISVTSGWKIRAGDIGMQ